MAKQKKTEERKQQFSPLKFVFSLVLAACFYLLDVPLSYEARAAMIITVFIGSLWLTEALPLFVTALFVPLLLVSFKVTSSSAAFYPFFSPTIALFLGGFIIARAMQKHGLDEYIASKFTGRFGKDPRFFLLGIMATTAFLSVWISNTASTALMLPIAVYVLVKSRLKPLKSNYAKALILGVAFAATIGGIATLTGTPPNGIVVADLAEHGINISYLEWIYYGLPFVLLFLPIAWAVIIAVYPPEIKKLKFSMKKVRLNQTHKKVVLIASLTMLLWLTSFAHGIPDSVIAMVPIILLFASDVLVREDLLKIDWPTLLLFGGGLSLGAAIDSTGLAAYLGTILSGLIVGQAYFVLLLMVIAFAVLMTLSASNTATAALLVPVIIALSSTLNLDVKTFAILAGIGTSLDFLVPVGTPPSAIAYGSGYVSVKDMLKVGVFLTLAGILLLAFLAWLYW